MQKEVTLPRAGRMDIYAQQAEPDARVVIENQFEESDDSHCLWLLGFQALLRHREEIAGNVKGPCGVTRAKAIGSPPFCWKAAGREPRGREALLSAARDLAEHVGVRAACKALGVARATFYRRRRPKTGQRQRRPAPARALDATERAEVFRVLCSPRFADRAPAEVYATLLDEGVYLCSERTMHRVLAENQAVRERRAQRSHPNHPKPEVMARAPNEVWSWDITRLLGPEKWQAASRRRRTSAGSSSSGTIPSTGTAASAFSRPSRSTSATPPRSSSTDRRCWPRPTPPGPTASWVARRGLRNSRWRSGSTAHSPSRRSMEQSRPTGERRGH